jgi:hypothetical protein
MKMVCTSFMPLRKNTLLGFCEIHISEFDMVLKDIAIHQKNGAKWAAPPAKRQLKDGVIVKDEQTGKPAYVNVVEFGSRASRDRFSQQVLDAVLARVPGAFAETDETCF